MADAGESERAVEIDGDVCGFVEEVGGGELAGEAEGGSHGADGVGAGGADADFEEFEEAGVHGVYCRRATGGFAGRAMVRISLRASSGFLLGLFCLQVLVGGLESAGHDGLVGFVEVDVGHAHAAPSSLDRGEDVGLIGDEGLLAVRG